MVTHEPVIRPQVIVYGPSVTAFVTGEPHGVAVAAVMAPALSLTQTWKLPRSAALFPRRL